MKKRKLALSALILILLAQASCKNKCNGTYKVKGRIYNGTTGAGHAYKSISIWYTEGGNVYVNSKVKELATTTTDSGGNFNLSYNCIDDEGHVGLQANDHGFDFSYYGLPLNQDIDQDFNYADSATLIININNVRISLGDTLYLRGGELGKVISIYESNYSNNKKLTYGFDRQSLTVVNFNVIFFYAFGYNNFLALGIDHPNINLILKQDPDYTEINIK